MGDRVFQNAEPAHPFDGKFEPEARGVRTCQVDAALVSIAVSLKRLADALDPESPTSFLRTSINCYGEGIGEAIQGQLIRGQRGIDQYEGR